LSHGHHIEGPAMIEEITTAVFVSASFDCMVDSLGSFVLYAKGREELIRGAAP
jgi:N-methylhydantoinase A